MKEGSNEGDELSKTIVKNKLRNNINSLMKEL